jgi:EpsI family protein
MMQIRAVLIFALLSATAVLAAGAQGPEAEISRSTLRDLPREIGDWRGTDFEPLSDDVVAQLGVDDYVNRHYVGAKALPIAVYIGYYDSQRQGDSIHSPQNCLPGAGWRPVEAGSLTVGRGDAGVNVNRYVITKGLDRQVVLYWYQGRGRVVAGEYLNKALLMFDAARLRRTNGGLVRLISPVVTTTEAATAEASAFAGVLLPHLSRYLP